MYNIYLEKEEKTRNNNIYFANVIVYFFSKISLPFMDIILS